MSFDPTPEQSLILLEAKSSNSLLINALAGAAKTTTLVMLASRLPLVPTLCCAFNKRIASKMAKRMPSHITCATMNSIGHRSWGQKTGKRLRVETDKSYNDLKAIIDTLPQAERRLVQADFAQYLRAVRLAKSSGYVPDSMKKFGESLTSEADLASVFDVQLDIEADDFFWETLDKVLEQSIAEAFEGLIDFDDQIYMSCQFGGSFPTYPIVMVDEAQDLSPLNHKMLEKLYGGRLIAVGDPWQAIYAFRGASHGSMAELKSKFSMSELTLSTSFRCPKRVVENALWRVPHMRYPDWAKDGLVQRLDSWSETDVPDGSAIICRNNAPLFSIGMSFIRRGRGIKILGNDVGAGLVKVLEKLGAGTSSCEASLSLVDEWERAQLKSAKRSREASIRDRAECLRVFAGTTSSLDEAIAYAKALFAASGPIQLMTGHKSKGGEWPIVFHLDSFLIPSKWAVREAEETGNDSKLQQEYNLKYVVESRAQESLYLVNSEDFI